MFEIDAMLDEWSDFPALERGYGKADNSYQLRCGFDSRNLYLSVKVKDERVLRKSGTRGQDSLSISLRTAPDRRAFTVRVLPGTRGFPVKKIGGKGAVLADTLLDDGWALEARVPLKRISGWGSSTPLLRGEVVYADADASGDKVDRQRRFAGSLHFSSHVPALRGLIKTLGKGVGKWSLDRLVDVDGVAGVERIIASGKHIAFLHDSFGFIELPVTSPRDVLKVDVIDFDGDGRSSILAHFRQRGGGGERELVTIWNLDAQGQFTMVMGFETAVKVGDKKLVNRWSLIPAGPRRTGKTKRPKKGAVDLVVEVTSDDNQGWTPASFAQVIPSADVRPILTPWGERTALLYYFEGELPLEIAAKPAR